MFYEGVKNYSVQDILAHDDELTIDPSFSNEPAEDILSAGLYFSRVIGAEQRQVHSDQVVADVYLSVDDGHANATIKMSYLHGTRDYRAFCRAMIAAGVPKGAPLSEAIGTLEVIALTYEDGQPKVAMRLPFQCENTIKLLAEQKARGERPSKGGYTQ